MNESYKKLEQGHIPDRPPGAVEEPQPQAVRNVVSEGGLVTWEKARNEYEHFLNMGADKITRQLDERIKAKQAAAAQERKAE